MKKISLQTKLKVCSVPNLALRLGNYVETIYDLVSSPKRELLRVRTVGKGCISCWEDFLYQYGLHFGMTVDEIRQYESEETSNCRTESSVDWEQRRYEIAKEMLPIIYYDDKPDEGEDYLTLPQIANEAVRFADALIKELKKSHE